MVESRGVVGVGMRLEKGCDERRGVVGEGVWWEKGCGWRRGMMREGVWWEKGCGGRRGTIRREGVDIEKFHEGMCGNPQGSTTSTPLVIHFHCTFHFHHTPLLLQ